MMPETLPAPAEASALVAVEPVPADRHPAAVYLASLAPGSRRTMRQALDAVAPTLTSGQASAETLAWSRLRTSTPRPFVRLWRPGMRRQRPTRCSPRSEASCARRGG